jgi:hypothetical protein
MVRGEGAGSHGESPHGNPSPTLARCTVPLPDLAPFPDFKSALRHAVYSSGRPLKAIAAALGYTDTQLSRKLAFNAEDPNYFPAHLLPDLIAATGSLLPAQWLVGHCFAAAAHAERSELERTRRALVEVAVALSERQLALFAAPAPSQISDLNSQ